MDFFIPFLACLFTKIIAGPFPQDYTVPSDTSITTLALNSDNPSNPANPSDNYYSSEYLEDPIPTLPQSTSLMDLDTPTESWTALNTLDPPGTQISYIQPDSDVSQAELSCSGLESQPQVESNVVEPKFARDISSMPNDPNDPQFLTSVPKLVMEAGGGGGSSGSGATRDAPSDSGDDNPSKDRCAAPNAPWRNTKPSDTKSSGNPQKTEPDCTRMNGNPRDAFCCRFGPPQRAKNGLLSQDGAVIARTRRNGCVPWSATSPICLNPANEACGYCLDRNGRLFDAYNDYYEDNDPDHQPTRQIPAEYMPRPPPRKTHDYEGPDQIGREVWTGRRRFKGNPKWYICTDDYLKQQGNLAA